MTQQKKKSLKQPTLDGVAGWLNGQGFPLEFITARVFRKAGFRAYVGSHLPSSEGTLREVDVFASASLTGKGVERELINLTMFAIVECKFSKYAAWVLKDREMISAAELNVYTPKNFLLSETAPIPMDRDGDYVHSKVAISSGVVVADKVGNRDIAFEAISKVADFGKTVVQNHQTSRAVYTMVVPVIVIDGMLCRAWLDDDDSADLRVEEVPMGHVVWSGSGSNIRVDIVTRSHLEPYTKALEAEAASIFRFLKKHATNPK